MGKATWQSTLARNDAELAGLSIGSIIGTMGPTVEPGSVEWAVSSALKERGYTPSQFQSFYDSLPHEEQQGWLSLIKGRAAEHLTAFELDGTVHEEWNVEGHDVVTGEDELVQVKAGSYEYIRSEAQTVDFPIHSSAEGAGIPGVEAHDWSALEIEQSIERADELQDGVGVLEIAGGSLIVSSALSGYKTIRAVQAGQIQLKDSPTHFVKDAGGKSVRCFLIGTAVASGQAIFVTGAAAYIVYRNRKLLDGIARGVYRAATSEFARTTTSFGLQLAGNAAMFTGRAVTSEMAIKIYKGTGKATYAVGKGAAKTAVAGTVATARAVTSKPAQSAYKATGKATWKIGRGAFKSAVALGRFMKRKIRKQ